MTDTPAPDANGLGIARRVCSDTACSFVQRSNPTPAVGALVEHEGDIILARNASWPGGWFALITGYLEAREDPKAAVEREVKEELNLDAIATNPIGNYIFERKNEVMLCYHVVATGDVKLSAELSEYRRYKPHELKPWPRATGFAVADWMKSRGLPVEFVDFP
jgi:NAD+ diphosphatase